MNRMGKRVMLISLILAVITSIIAFTYLKSLKAPAAADEKTTLLVAAETIPPRTLIDKKMVKEIEVTQNSIFDSCIKDSSELIGKYTKETIVKDEGFHRDNIYNNADEELTLKMGKDQRAISINVNGASGVSDLIKQGDFVDVIVYLPEKKDDQGVARPDISKIILQNIEILAIDKKTDRNGELRTEIPQNYLVTLSVPVSDVEKLVLAENIAQLKLVLRPEKADNIQKTDGSVWQELSLDDLNKMKDTVTNENNQAEQQDTTASQDNSNNSEYLYYTIKHGDTLRSISKTFYGTPEKYAIIKDANGIVDENEIEAEKSIKIPVLN